MRLFALLPALFLCAHCTKESHKIVHSFLVNFSNCLESSNFTQLSTLFTDSFSYNHCGATFKKNDVLNRFKAAPVGSKFSMKLKKGSKFFPISKRTLTFQGSFSGLSMDIPNGQFYIYKSFIDGNEVYRLTSGFTDIPKEQCALLEQENSRSLQNINQIPTDNGTWLFVKSFLHRLEEDIDQHLENDLESLIDEQFVFGGCRGTYIKGEVLKMLQSVPPGIKPTFTLLSAALGAHSISYEIEIKGFGAKTLQAQFELRLRPLQLTSGQISNC